MGPHRKHHNHERGTWRDTTKIAETSNVPFLAFSYDLPKDKAPTANALAVVFSTELNKVTHTSLEEIKFAQKNWQDKNQRKGL
jgi:hypothetical protein